MKHKYAPIGFIYLFGLICASFLNAALCLAAAGALFAVFTVLLILKKRRFSVYIFTAGTAALVFGLYSLFFIAPARALTGSGAAVSGKVLERDRPDNDTVRLVISGSADGVPVKLALYAPDFGADIGDSVSFTAVFTDFRDSAEFSETQYNFSKGIFLKASAADEPVITEKGGFSLISLLRSVSLSLRERVNSVLDGEEGGLLNALFFGDRSGLSPYLAVMLKRAGLAHMACVSGIHLSLIVNLAAIFINLLPKRRVYMKYGVIAALTLLLMLFFGMTASVMRSGFMMLIYYGAEPLRRRSSVLYSLGSAAMLIVLFQPCACRDMGLWMSMLGTFGAGVLSPEVCRRIIHGKRFGRIKEALAASVCAVVCTLPVSALCFGGISIASAVSSLIVYPLFFAALVFMLLTAVTAGAFAEIFLLPAGAAARAMIPAAELIGGLPFSYITLDGSFYPYFTELSLMGLVLTAMITKSFWHTLRFFMLSACVFATVCVFQRLSVINDIVIDIYSDGRGALITAESKMGVSAVLGSDSPRLCRELISRTAGRRTGLVCLLDDAKNNLPQIKLCEPLTLHAPDSPDAGYDAGGEYSVSAKDGVITLNIRGTAVALLPVNTRTDADIAVIGGYRKEREASGAAAEILCDKRYYYDSAINAYYDKVRIIINAGGQALIRRERSAA